MATIEQAKEALMISIQQDVEQILQCPLSNREKEILSLVASGYEDKEIARLLKLCIQTVKNHHRNIRAKLGASNRTRAVVIALQYGWIAFPDEIKEERDEMD